MNLHVYRDRITAAASLAALILVPSILTAQDAFFSGQREPDGPFADSPRYSGASPAPVAAAFGLRGGQSTAGPMRRQRKVNVVYSYTMEKIPQEELELHNRVKKLRQQLHDSPTDEKREELKKQLLDALQSQFDADYARREKEVAELEERIAKLRAKLDKRKEGRVEIVEVRFKSIVHSSEGMAFPDPYGGQNTPFGVPAALAPPGSPSPARLSPYGEAVYPQPPTAVAPTTPPARPEGLFGDPKPTRESR